LLDWQIYSVDTLIIFIASSILRLLSCVGRDQEKLQFANMLRYLLGFQVESSFELQHAAIDVVEVVVKLMEIDGFYFKERILFDSVRMSASWSKEIRSSR
jgi:hypothetical protein